MGRDGEVQRGEVMDGLRWEVAGVSGWDGMRGDGSPGWAAKDRRGTRWSLTRKWKNVKGNAGIGSMGCRGEHGGQREKAVGTEWEALGKVGTQGSRRV